MLLRRNMESFFFRSYCWGNAYKMYLFSPFCSLFIFFRLSLKVLLYMRKKSFRFSTQVHLFFMFLKEEKKRKNLFASLYMRLIGMKHLALASQVCTYPNCLQFFSFFCIFFKHLRPFLVPENMKDIVFQVNLFKNKKY